MYKYDEASVLSSTQDLEEHLGEVSKRALVKEIDHVSPMYAEYIKASPFVVLASVGPEGVDTSPRGDAAGFVEIVSPTKLMLPERRGNNRADTLRNIVRDPRVSLLFLIPGVGETLRVIGDARVIVDEALCKQFTVQNKPARFVIEVDVHAVYFQCQKAFARSKLWDSDARLPRGQLPTAGELIKAFDADFDAKNYDDGYAEYMKETMY